MKLAFSQLLLFLSAELKTGGYHIKSEVIMMLKQEKTILEQLMLVSDNISEIIKPYS